MELWIRSQDRRSIFKVDRLTIDYTNSIFCDYNDVFLGSYETKERALEVLDEIQTILRGKYATSFDYKVSLNGFKKEEVEQMLEQMAVYEMPDK